MTQREGNATCHYFRWPWTGQMPESRSGIIVVIVGCTEKNFRASTIRPRRAAAHHCCERLKSLPFKVRANPTASKGSNLGRRYRTKDIFCDTEIISGRCAMVVIPMWPACAPGMPMPGQHAGQSLTWAGLCLH